MAKYREILAYVIDYLDKEDPILASVYGTFSNDLRMRSLTRHGLIILTNDRIGFFMGSLSMKETQTFYYNKMSCLEYSEGKLGHSILFDYDEGNIKFKWILEGEIDKFLTLLKSKVKG